MSKSDQPTGFQPDPQVIRWRLHLASPIHKVYQALSTDEGRASFWAESAIEQDGVIHFVFPNGAEWKGKILQVDPPSIFSLHYYGGSVTSFNLEEDGKGGTNLTLTDVGVPDAYRSEVIAGWVSVLMNLKAAVDFGVDLRIHDHDRNWNHGFVEN